MISSMFMSGYAENAALAVSRRDRQLVVLSRVAPALVLAACCARAVVMAAALPAAPDAEAQCRALGLHECPRPFDALVPDPKDLLTWDTQSRVVGFRNTYRLYPGDVFHAGGAPPLPLPPAAASLPPVQYVMDGRPLSLAQYLRRQQVTGLLVLKDGHVAYEYYGAGNTPTTLWTSRSVAKSVVSILIGIALREGSIGALTDPLTRYVPELKGTAWEGVNLRELLQHESGVAWNENYADPHSDFAALTRCEAGPDAYACVLQLVTSLKRKPGVQPGAVWSYCTGGAWLVGRVLERATGMSIARFLETRVWSRVPMQSDGVWEALFKDSVDMGGHGFNATLRDYGRFALFVAGGGRLATGEALLPPDWLQQSATWSHARGSVTPAAPQGQYGYQWWYGGVDPKRHGAESANETARHSLWAEGIYGQSIAIDPDESLVMVQWSTWQAAETPASLYDEQSLLFDALARALHGR